MSEHVLGRQILHYEVPVPSVVIEEQERELDMRNEIAYMDGKIFRLGLENIKLQSLQMHTLLTIGLIGVKQGNPDYSIPKLLDMAEEWLIDDEFLEWIEQYTPYKYSAKKKRLVRRNKERWNIEKAFFNPEITRSDLLEKELETYYRRRQKPASVPLDIIDFSNFLEKVISDRDQRIKERLENNRRNGKRMCQTAEEQDDINASQQRKKRKKRRNRKEKAENTGSVITTAERQYTLPVEASTLPLSKQTTPLSAEQMEARQARLENERLIKAYLSRNPLPDSTGPMGMPQSKYRYGTFGLGSMEYDAWRRS